MPFLIENNLDGQLVQPNDIESFVDAILNYKTNPEKTKAIIHMARHKAEQFDWNTIKQKWISTLN